MNREREKHFISLNLTKWAEFRNRDARSIIKQYWEKEGKKSWMPRCQTGFVPSSDECEAFNKLVLQKEGNEEVWTLIVL